MSTNITNAAYGGNLTLKNAVLATGTTSTFSTTNAIDYTVQGRFATLGAQANTATPTVDGNTGKAFVPLAADQACIFAFFVNLAGAVSVAQGPVVKNSELTGGSAAAQFPQSDDSKAPFGYMLVQASAALAAPWTFGTTIWASTGLTVAARSVMDYPAQPITG